MHRALTRCAALLIAWIGLTSCTPTDSPTAANPSPSFEQVGGYPPPSFEQVGGYPLHAPDFLQTSTPLSDTTTPGANSPLKRRDSAPLDLVALQLTAVLSDSTVDSCTTWYAPEEGFELHFDRLDLEIGQRFGFCFSGVAEDQPLDIEVMRPDGTRRAIQIPARTFSETAILEWLPLPGDPLGEYTVSALHANQQTTKTFTLLPATQPRIAVSDRDGSPDDITIQPGQALRIVLAGFPPQQTVALHLYHREQGVQCSVDPCDQYVSTIRVPVDQGGQAISVLPTLRDDPEGIYHIVPLPAVDPAIAVGRNEFRIVATPQPTVGLQMVVVTRDLDLWTGLVSRERVVERPRLYEGALVTILRVKSDAVRVRTDDDVVGWLRDVQGALSADLAQQGERVRFAVRQRVQVVWSNGLPLRSAPRSDASKLNECLSAGTEAIVEEIRGDWLRVTLDDSTSGWVRWYYDDTIYIAAASD